MIETEDEARHFIAERCSSQAYALLERLAEALLVEAESQNLISRSTTPSVWQRHIADSAQLLEHVPRETGLPWLDLGTGAGFPGLVLAIMRPDIQHVLVESRKRRVEWLGRVVEMLDLRNCRIEGARLQLVDTFEAGVITARAFAPLPELIDLSARFSTERTVWLLPKGRSAKQERDALNPAWQKMFHVKQSVTSADAAILVGNGRPNIGSRR